ncbi:MAG: nuclear transport factor 2 family protein [Blastocatellia bacterium]|nr:nuclear transport factor 2 family protein [Blastocatellia bacterium]
MVQSKLHRVLAVLVFVSSALFATEVLGQTNDEAALRDVLLRSASSFAKNDLAEARKVWATDESLTIFESGHANYGWADYRDNHLVPEMGEMKNTKYGFSDIRIHLAGKTAWATFKYSIEADVKENGKPRHVDGAGLGTAILEKRTDGWRIVHWHSSAPRRAPAAAPVKKP